MGRKRRGGGALPTELPPGVAALGVPDGIDAWLRPENPVINSNATRIISNQFVGMSLLVGPHPMQFNRLSMRIAVVSVAGSSLVVGVYQQAQGLSAGPWPRVGAWREPAINAVATVEMIGDCELQPGVAAVLCGTEGAASDYTYIAWSIGAYNLLNTNTPAGQRPLVFSTVIPVAAMPPASFDPVGDAAEIAVNLGPVCRVRRV